MKLLKENYEQAVKVTIPSFELVYRIGEVRNYDNYREGNSYYADLDTENLYDIVNKTRDAIDAALLKAIPGSVETNWKDRKWNHEDIQLPSQILIVHEDNDFYAENESEDN